MNNPSDRYEDPARGRTHRETISDIELGIGVVLMMVVIVLVATVRP